jgi:hypothetical protein
MQHQADRTDVAHPPILTRFGGWRGACAIVDGTMIALHVSCQNVTRL